MGSKNRLPLNFLIVIDEARHFSNFNVENCNFSVLSHINRSSRLMSPRLGGFLVMMDTQSSLGLFTAMRSFPSLRQSLTSFEQMFIYDLQTFDLHYNPEIEIDVETASSPQFMVTMGRPIWYPAFHAQIENTYFEANYPAAKLLLTVKLESWDLFSFTSETAAALICSRTTLGLGPFTLLSQNLVSSHMAILGYYNASKAEAFIHYPSDPTLAWGSKSIMRQLNPHQWDSIFLYLGRFLCQREINIGYRGEIVAQLLCLHLADLVGQSSLIKVKRWVDNLLGKNHDIQTDVSGKRTKIEVNIGNLINEKNQGILDGIIYLTHFVQVIKYCPNRTDLVEIMKRGCGIMCANNQQGIDLMIPVVLPNSFCKNSNFIKESCSEFTKFKRIDQNSVTFPKKPECLRGEFPVEDIYQTEDISKISDDFKIKLSKNLSRNVDNIIYSEHPTKLSSDNSTIIGKSMEYTPDSSDFARAKSDFPLVAEIMSYILIQVKTHMSNESQFSKVITAQALGTVETTETLRPHMIIGMIFTSNPSSINDFQMMKRPSGFKILENTLEFNVINPHRALENSYISKGIQNLLDIIDGPMAFASRSDQSKKFRIIARTPTQYCANPGHLINFYDYKISDSNFASLD